MVKSTKALLRNSDTDYTLQPNHQSCWITVDNCSVFIMRSEKTVSVRIYAKNVEDEDELGELLILKEIAQDAIEIKYDIMKLT